MIGDKLFLPAHLHRLTTTRLARLLSFRFQVLSAHDPSSPMMLFYTPHVVHCPLQVPPDYLEKFAKLTNGTDEKACHAQTPYINPTQQITGGGYACRAQYHAMVNVLDDNVANISALFKAKGMWDRLLIVFSSDNGGPIDMQENAANNFPHRGGKYSEFEGGVRAAAFVGGGFVPVAARGTRCSHIIAIADWYGTFAALAGIDPTDHRAAANAQWGNPLPPIDSANVWGNVIGTNSTPARLEVPVDGNCLIQGDWKILFGTIAPAGWTSPMYPNSSSSGAHDPNFALKCGSNTTGNAGCLFNIALDPSERVNLVAPENSPNASMLTKAKALAVRLGVLKDGFWQNNEKGVDACPPNVTSKGHPCACWMAANVYHGYLGPYQGVSLTPLYPTPPPTPTPPPIPTPPPTRPNNQPCSKEGPRPAVPAAGASVQLDAKNIAKYKAKQIWSVAPGCSSGPSGGLITLTGEGAATDAAAASLCMSGHGPPTPEGHANIVLAKCDPKDQEQLWVVTKTKSADSATIRSVAHHTDCIDLQRGQYNLELFGCSGTSTQVYVFNADGTISSLSTQGGQKEGEVVAVC